jgi:hypothetical protein
MALSAKGITATDAPTRCAEERGRRRDLDPPGLHERRSGHRLPARVARGAPGVPERRPIEALVLERTDRGSKMGFGLAHASVLRERFEHQLVRTELERSDLQPSLETPNALSDPRGARATSSVNKAT